MFRMVFSSIIRSLRSFASKQSAVSVWHTPVAVCTVLNSWWRTERPSETCRVLLKINETLVHPVGFIRGTVKQYSRGEIKKNQLVDGEITRLQASPRTNKTQALHLTCGRLQERPDTICNAKGGESALTMFERNETLPSSGLISCTRNDEVARRPWNQYGHVTKKECNYPGMHTDFF